MPRRAVLKDILAFLCTLAAREEGAFHNDMLAHCEKQPGGQAKFYECRHKGLAFSLPAH